MKKRKQLLFVVLAVMLMLSSVVAYGAEIRPAGSASVQMVASGSGSLTRISDRKAELEVYCRSSVVADYIKATCTVQKQGSNGKYTDYADSFEIKDTNTPTLFEVYNLTVGSSGTYRVKVVFEDKVNGITTRTSAYYTQAVGL